VNDPHYLRRFVDAQEGVFDTALAELRGGSKRSHWMWFIFPQLAGLGRSPTAQFFGIASVDEARAYLAHPILGPRLRQSMETVLPWIRERTAERILGSTDALKLRSCLTLFDLVEPGGIFNGLLTGFYGGERDERTLALLNAER
jgi:uncharacterized protein (DUF1810 family)